MKTVIIFWCDEDNGACVPYPPPASRCHSILIRPLCSVHLRVLDGSSYGPEQQELALESLLEFTREPALMTDVYINYDCDVQCTNLFETICHSLSSHALPRDGMVSVTRFRKGLGKAVICCPVLYLRHTMCLLFYNSKPSDSSCAAYYSSSILLHEFAIVWSGIARDKQGRASEQAVVLRCSGASHSSSLPRQSQL